MIESLYARAFGFPDQGVLNALKILAEDLLGIGAIQFGAFKLKLHEKNPDAPLSPIYVNLRLLRSFPAVLSRAINAYDLLSSPLDYSLLADIPTSVTPIVTGLALKTEKPMISPRMDKKSHGSGDAIDGYFSPGLTVLLLDDLITKADSKLEAIAILTTAGLVVRDVAVLVDREQGGAAELEKQGVALHSVFTLRQLLAYYRKTNCIDRDMYDKVLIYLVANS